jgi:nucleoside-diphosphate-sugar epimerase
MKVLVTGATGFVGKYVVAELLRRNIKVIASGRSEPAQGMFGEGVTFVEHDIYSSPAGSLFEKFHSPDLAIHLGWGFLPDFKTINHLEIELPAQKKFLSRLLNEGLKDLTVTGTCLEYGLQEGELTEDTPVNPSVPYSQAKVQLREYLEGLKKEKPFDFRWVRFFYMYGQGQSPKSILAQLDKALDANEQTFNMSKGEQWRDYLPVETVAENLVIFALQRRVQGIINCCSNKPISIKDLVLNHLKKRNKTINLNLGHYPYPDYEPFRFWGNNSKQNDILKHEPGRTI